MGHSSDRLAGRFGISREEQDAFAARSHVNAAKAHKEGLYKEVCEHGYYVVTLRMLKQRHVNRIARAPIFC